MDLYDRLIELGADAAHREKMVPSERTFGDVRVAFETTPEDTAAIVEVSTRTLQRWEKRGLPSVGRGAKKRYMWPHSCWWIHAWEIRQKMGDDAPDISLDEAIAWHSLRVAQVHFNAAGVKPPWARGKR